jgi:hypothetical protein
MPTSTPHSKKLIWTGWILSAIPALMLISGGCYALTKTPMVIQGMQHTGYPVSTIAPIGIIEIVCAILFLIPRTAFYGAILLTAYFGGAVATHLRIGESELVVAIVFGIIVWVALALRDPRFRAIIP